MTPAGADADLDARVAETIACIEVEPDGDRWNGRAPDWYGEVVFGGFVVGQAVHAATRSAPAGTRIHSLHAYFLAPTVAGPSVSYDVTAVRDGRSFSTRRLEASQDGRPVFTMTCSFTADGRGYEYGGQLDPAIPGPEALSAEVGEGPWETASLGPTEPGPDGFRRSTHRLWIRTVRPVPDDPHLHDALLALMTDITWTSSRPLHLDGDERGIISLDHAVWFHRRARVDEWLHYDAHSLVNTAGRGLLRGTIYGPDRRLAASVTQEAILRPYDSFDQ